MTSPTEELIGKIRDQRFDGYTENMLADQIEQIRSGSGIGSIGAAVDALQAGATALDEVGHTLRAALGKLGVAWISDAAQQATAVFTDHAAFADDSKDKLVRAAESGFALGEAFTRTLHRLPDAATLRAGADGLGFGDFLGSLVGYETDQAERVKAAALAKSQAIDALNAYARDTGDGLSAVEALAALEGFALDGQPVGEHDGADETATFGSMGTTPAAVAGPGEGAERPSASGPGRDDSAGRCGPTPQGVASGGSACGQRTGASTAPGSPSDGGPTAPAPTAPSSTAPSGSSGIVGGVIVGGGSTGAAARPGGSATGQAPAPGAPGAAVGVPGGTSGSGASPDGAKATGTGAGGSPASGGAGVRGGEPAGRAGGALGVGGGKAGFVGGGPGTPTEAPLDKGKLVSATPQAPAGGGASGLGPGFGTQPRPSLGGELAGGAAALGAAGLAATGEGDRERRARGFGRETEVDGRPLHEFPVGAGDSEAEQEARTVERIEPADIGPGEPEFLQQAAPVAEGGSRVRSYGIDDVDLFSDERMVARDVIDGADKDGPTS